MFQRGVALDGPVATVVVRQHQPLIANHLSGTKAPEVHDRVLQTPRVDAVDILGGNLHPQFAHLLFVQILEQQG